ncbi:IS630 family transposase [Photorhabdus bodei]|uniref:IS630 family transposase n=1 Tax=Photorhabdus bodei TaxID=2029681 RepID=A0AAW6BT05_9GAMM|nr:IS630 family transposase [Photorhabdus bodei]MDB6375097.1 IS630 family transposase [Photorhabdus bodei]
MSIIAPIPRDERRRMQKEIQRISDKGYARRLIAILLLHKGKMVIETRDITGAECSSIGRGVNWFTEGDIDLKPKIGADWTLKGQQKKVVTPGNNCKHYLTGALHAGIDKVLYVSGSKKNTELFIAMLEKLKQHYQRAKNITLIRDNYIIHKSRKTEAWLKNNPKFRLLFQPIYSPWVNLIEKPWYALHETITRNHRFQYMWELLRKIKHFMHNVSPFPGGSHGMANI